MQWICQVCERQNDPDKAQCPGCLNDRSPIGVELVSDESGKEVQCRINTVFGTGSLTSLGDSGIKYVSRDQFRVEKKTDHSGWIVAGVTYAKNPTYLNGVPIPEGGELLKEGDKLSIKGKFLNLTVRYIY